jgi:hypothetical protein
MQTLFDFLDEHPRLNVAGAVFCGLIVLAIDGSDFPLNLF